MFKTISGAPAFAILAAAALAASPALAQERDTRTTGVSYQDLDLSTEAGRAELAQRIDDAARHVCGMGERSVGSNIVSRESRDCFRAAKRELEQHFAGVIERRNHAG